MGGPCARLGSTGDVPRLPVDERVRLSLAEVGRLYEAHGLAVPRGVAEVDDPPLSPQPELEEARQRAGVALDDGRLLVLERALAGDSTGMGGFRIRIYLADPSRATDVSEPPFRSGLAGRADWTPASKVLLWEQRFGLPVSNFEGMALGPRLSRGTRSLLLIADNGGGTWQSIYALELRGAP